MHRSDALIDIVRTIPTRGGGASLRDLNAVVLRPVVVGGLPRHGQIEIITACNLRCAACPRTVALGRGESGSKATWTRMMSLAHFKAVIDQLPGLLTVSLHGIGEPLLHPHLIEMVAYAADRKIAPRFISNGTLLSPALGERLILAGLRRLIVSMDGATATTFETWRSGACWSEVTGNVGRFVARARDLTRHPPPVHISMVVHSGNCGEVTAMVDLVRSLGASGLILSPVVPADKAGEGLRLGGEDWARVVGLARGHARRRNVALNIRLGGRRRPDSGVAPSVHRCLHPWLSAVVTIDGDVMPCCNIRAPSGRLGNIFLTEFSTLWNDLPYANFRKALKCEGRVPEVCRWCPEH
jgi:radical SAM protein with 4Fe4S-binding SPASM domain